MRLLCLGVWSKTVYICDFLKKCIEKCIENEDIFCTTSARTIFLLQLSMQKILLILICLFVSFEVKSEDEKIFDKYGKYKGKFDDGRFFDPYGKYNGKITNEGSIYSPYGKFLGKIESSGKIYDPYGKYKGRIENKKKIFDSSGSLEGSISR